MMKNRAGEMVPEGVIIIGRILRIRSVAMVTAA